MVHPADEQNNESDSFPFDFYNRLSKDDRFIYMQGDGCSNFRGSNNNSVYVNGIIEYIKNIIQ